MLEKIYTADEACAHLRISRRTLQKLTQQRRIGFIRTDGKLQFEESALAAYVAKFRNVPAPADVTAKRNHAVTVARSVKAAKVAR
jgi:excisionase family DNA binding protein